MKRTCFLLNRYRDKAARIVSINEADAKVARAKVIEAIHCEDSELFLAPSIPLKNVDITIKI